MNIVELARQLGYEIQKEDSYNALQSAKKLADADEQLQDLIGEFNLKRMSINNEACKEERNEENLKKLNEEMRTVYSKIMSNNNMKAYNDAKTELDTIVQRVLAIITKSAEGEDPDTADYIPDCAGDCSSCSGCH